MARMGKYHQELDEKGIGTESCRNSHAPHGNRAETCKYVEAMEEIESLKAELSAAREEYSELNLALRDQHGRAIARAEQAEAKFIEMGLQLTDTEIEHQQMEKERDELRAIVQSGCRIRELLYDQLEFTCLPMRRLGTCEKELSAARKDLKECEEIRDNQRQLWDQSLGRTDQTEAKLAEVEKERDSLKGRFGKAVREWLEEVEVANQQSNTYRKALEEIDQSRKRSSVDCADLPEQQVSDLWAALKRLWDIAREALQDQKEGT